MLSAFLFSLYINDLIVECINTNIGALFKNLNTCIIVYADDVILISPKDNHLQKLLNICGEFGQKWNIKFNPTKSNIVEFGRQFFNFLLKPSTYPKNR